MKSKMITLVAAVGLLAVSCQKSKFECDLPSDKPFPNPVTEPFKGVELNSCVNVFLSEAPEHDVRIEGTAQGIKGVDTYTEDEILHIDKAKNNCLKGEDVDILVSAPEYELLKISGSDNM